MLALHHPYLPTHFQRPCLPKLCARAEVVLAESVSHEPVSLDVFDDGFGSGFARCTGAVAGISVTSADIQSAGGGMPLATKAATSLSSTRSSAAMRA